MVIDQKDITPSKNVARKVVYLPDSLVERISAYQKESGMALTQLCRQLLDDHLRERGF